MAAPPDAEPPPRVLRVTRANAAAGWAALAAALAAAARVPGAYVAVDTEFTGLGTSDAAAARADALDARYAWLVALAATRAVTSLGANCPGGSHGASRAPRVAPRSLVHSLRARQRRLGQVRSVVVKPSSHAPPASPPSHG